MEKREPKKIKVGTRRFSIPYTTLNFSQFELIGSMLKREIDRNIDFLKKSSYDRRVAVIVERTPSVSILFIRQAIESDDAFKARCAKERERDKARKQTKRQKQEQTELKTLERLQKKHAKKIQAAIPMLSAHVKPRKYS